MVVAIHGNQLGGGKKLSAILLTQGRNPIFVPHVWGTMVIGTNGCRNTWKSTGGGKNGSEQWF